MQDVLDFKPKEQYTIWHDRAAFHFQTEEKTINSYLNLVSSAVSGNVIVGTFSTDGPTKCSGLDVKQYDEKGMKSRFESKAFKNILCKRENHMTPMGAIQNFVFCLFKKLGVFNGQKA